MKKTARRIFFFLYCYSLFIPGFFLGSLSQTLVKKIIPALSGKLGAKIGAKVAWPIASRFLGTLSPYLSHIGTLGTMFREKVAKPGGTLSLLGGMGSATFFLFSLRQLQQKMHADAIKLQKLKEQLKTIEEEEIKTREKPAESAIPEEIESLDIHKREILAIEKQILEEKIKTLSEKRDDKIKLFFKIASPFSKVMLFALYGGIAYGLQYSGSLIEWIGGLGIYPEWGGKFAPR